MESTCTRQASEIRNAAAKKPGARLLVGIVGPPGCGKSTIAENLAQIFNSMPPASCAINGCQHPSEDRPQSKMSAIVVPIDGFHLTRRQLDQFKDPAEAHARRGAPWTFDVDAILKFVERLAITTTFHVAQRPVIHVASFDHAIKNHIENAIVIAPQGSIVILEGNHLLLDEDMWRDIRSFLDLGVFVDSDAIEGRERVPRRQMLAGIEPTLEAGKKRFDSNDGPNGALIRQRKVVCDVVVKSVSTMADG